MGKQTDRDTDEQIHISRERLSTFETSYSKQISRPISRALSKSDSSASSLVGEIQWTALLNNKKTISNQNFKFNKNKIIFNKKTRRTLKKKICENKLFTIIGTNCNGLYSKKESLMNNINLFNPSICMVQESKLYKKGQIKIPNYQIFESIRPFKEGGGLFLAAHCNIEPVLIADYQEKGHEILVIQAKFGISYCRFINAYGPQESSATGDQLKTIEFYAFLEQEIKNAQLLGHLICLQMDSNAKLGSDFIPNDPHSMSSNGQFISDIIMRNDLIVCNGSEKCEGLVTRERHTTKGFEQSVLDYLIVCPKLFTYFSRMKIDKDNSFRRYIKTKNKTSIIKLFI